MNIQLDLAHIVLIAWASGASTLVVLALFALKEAHERFDEFINEIKYLNNIFERDNQDINSR